VRVPTITGMSTTTATTVDVDWRERRGGFPWDADGAPKAGIGASDAEPLARWPGLTFDNSRDYSMWGFAGTAHHRHPAGRRHPRHDLRPRRGRQHAPRRAPAVPQPDRRPRRTVHVVGGDRRLRDQMIRYGFDAVGASRRQISGAAPVHRPVIGRTVNHLPPVKHRTAQGPTRLPRPRPPRLTMRLIHRHRLGVFDPEPVPQLRPPGGAAGPLPPGATPLVDGQAARTRMTCFCVGTGSQDRPSWKINVNSPGRSARNRNRCWRDEPTAEGMAFLKARASVHPDNPPSITRRGPPAPASDTISHRPAAELAASAGAGGPWPPLPAAKVVAGCRDRGQTSPVVTVPVGVTSAGLARPRPGGFQRRTARRRAAGRLQVGHLLVCRRAARDSWSRAESRQRTWIRGAYYARRCFLAGIGSALT
jgi:hypothetical protein